MRVRQHLANTHPIRASQGWRSAISLKQITNIKVPVFGDVASRWDSMGVNIEDAVADPGQMGMAQPRLFLNFPLSRGERRIVSLLAVPARLQPARQLLMPDEQGEPMGWVDNEGGRSDMSLEGVPVKRRRLTRHKGADRGQMACLGGVSGRVGPKRSKQLVSIGVD